MRVAVCIILAAIGCTARPALAEPQRPASIWKSVQRACNATAAKPPSELGRRIAQGAIDEFHRFDGHQIDSDGKLFHFGQVEGDQVGDAAAGRQARLGDLGWWQVLKYWRALFGKETADDLEVLGYRDATTTTPEQQAATRLPTSAARLLQITEGVSDPDLREILREAVWRAAIMDTAWSAAFVSYVLRQAGVDPTAFKFGNAHRAYIYDAFAASTAEAADSTGTWLYRACPVYTTRPRPGDLICHQRERTLADATDQAVRDRILTELETPDGPRTVRSTHCDIVAHVDTRSRRVYIIGGNVHQSIAVKKMNLRGRRLRLSRWQQGNCGGKHHWTLPPPSADAAPAPGGPSSCSLNDKKWFVLLQMR